MNFKVGKFFDDFIELVLSDTNSKVNFCITSWGFTKSNFIIKISKLFYVFYWLVFKCHYWLWIDWGIVSWLWIGWGIVSFLIFKAYSFYIFKIEYHGFQFFDVDVETKFQMSVLFEDYSHFQEKVQGRQHNQISRLDGYHDILTFFLLVCKHLV